MSRDKKFTHQEWSRRDLLKFTAGVSGTLALGSLGTAASLLGDRAFAQGSAQSAVLLVYLSGGYNALFGSADSFANNAFGVNNGNMLNLGNGLVVDSVFNTLSPFVKSHMASVGVNHGIAVHGQAQNVQLSVKNQNPLMTIAAGLGGNGSIKCANVGREMAPGPKAAVDGVTLQQIADMQTTIDALGGGTPDPTMPKRELAAKAVAAAEGMSKKQMEGNSNSLSSASSGFKVAIETLSKPAQVFNPNELKTAYNLSGTAVSGFTSKMAAAELAIRAGANVVAAVSGSTALWDSHGDSTGQSVRRLFTNEILPGLKIFTDRMLQEQGPFNVTIVLIGDFARSLPGSDHATVSVATVIGPNIKTGTTGKVSAAVRLPDGTPSVDGLWGLVATAAKAPQTTINSFGGNPHTALSKG